MMEPMQDDDMMKAVANDLGIAGLPLEEQQQLVAQFGEVAIKAATLAVTEKLSPEKVEEFGTLAEAGDPAALQAFLDREVPGHEALAKAAVAAEVAQFKTVQTA